MRDGLIGALRQVLGDDHRRIWHALQVLAEADAISAELPGVDLAVVEAAAILHDIGIHEAERRHGSAAGCWQELEGPPIARRILADLGMDATGTDHVCRIIAQHHSARDIDTPEFRIIWDADWLVNWPDECAGLTPAGTRERIDRIFRTAPGRRRAMARHLGG